eukprot:3630158-Prymnesium_polylepis.1
MRAVPAPPPARPTRRPARIAFRSVSAHPSVLPQLLCLPGLHRKALAQGNCHPHGYVVGRKTFVLHVRVLTKFKELVPYALQSHKR